MKVSNRSELSDIKGFTLIEVVIIVAILGILASIATMRYAEARESALRNLCVHNQKQLTEMLAVASLDDPDLRTQFLFEAQIRSTLIDGGYMKKVFDCPYGIYFTEEQSTVRCSYTGGSPWCGGGTTRPHLLDS